MSYETKVKRQKINGNKGKQIGTEKITEHEVLKQILNSIVARRTALGLSQRDLAERCGIPQSSVARIESSKNIPNLITLLKIFRQLGLHLTIAPSDPVKEQEGE